MSSSNQGLSPGPPAAPAKSAFREKRLSSGRRLNIAISVKVFSDAGSPDFQTCCTYEISFAGVRLVAPAGIKEVGQIVTLQRHNRRAKYKVAWIGQPDTPEAGQVGVEALEPNYVIWENELKTRLTRSE